VVYFYMRLVLVVVALAAFRFYGFIDGPVG
jgi:hypothetical protein